MYVLIENDDKALEIALKYRNYFGDVLQALDTDLNDMPETVPYVLTYDGFSDHFIDGDRRYLLADDIHQRASADFALTQDQVAASYSLWQNIAMDIIDDNYAPIENFSLTALPQQQDPFPDMFTKWYTTMGLLYSAALGIGALGGAASGTIKSRKRYGREFKNGY